MKTSHGALVFSPAAELLLCHASGTRHWDIPKGEAEPGESSAEAAAREAREECGQSLDAGRLLDLGRFAYLRAKDLRLHATLVGRVDPRRLACSSTFVDRQGRSRPEMDAFRWVVFGDVPSWCGPSMTAVLTQRLSLPQVFRDALAAVDTGAIGAGPADASA